MAKSNGRAAQEASPLWDWLAKETPANEELLWCHTTDAFRLRSLIGTGTLPVNRCKILDEDLLYFFYGRPAFRRDEDEQLGLTAKAPVVVVLKPGIVENAVRMFPFDSGAFQSGRYQRWIHPRMRLSDFGLGQNPEAPRRCVAAFFGSSENYLKMVAHKPVRPYAGEFEVESLVAILNDPDARTADDRRLAVELQVGRDVAFNDSTIEALVLPDELAEAPWIKSFLEGPCARARVIRYECALQRRAAHYQALLEERVSDLYRNRGAAV